MKIIAVTGTGTGVGKTVVSAALAACAGTAGRSVAVLKPVQTGVLVGEPGDLAVVAGLTGLSDLHEYVRYDEPLAPGTAARRRGEPGPEIGELSGWVRGFMDRDLVIVEGAGGLLAEFNTAGDTLLGLLMDLGGRHDVHIVLVTSSGLGSLNAAALTSKAAQSEGNMRIGSLVVGSWPIDPGLAERCNLHDLPRYAECPIRGVIAEGAGGLDPAPFTELALRSLTPTFGGSLDAREFVSRLAGPILIPPAQKGRS
jgi:dethiobiotin synthetase